MPVRAINIFNDALERTDHFLTLYKILCDTRQRDVRSDWGKKFKKLMNWNSRDKIVRIDGQDKNSILVLREKVGIDRTHFTHDYLSELLRSSIVTSVSALDRYIHELIVHHCWKLLSQKEENIPKKLREFKIPLLSLKRSIEKVKNNQNSRPAFLIKEKIQEVLHRDYTFQKPNNIDEATKLLGINNDFWRKIGQEMPGKPKGGKVQERLTEISNRRNQIVHEADLILKNKAKEITIREITFDDAKKMRDWIESFVNAFERVVENEGI